MTAPRAHFSKILPFAPRRAGRRGAFTLIEVMIALGIAATMSVVIVLSYVNILGAYQRAQRRPARDLDLTTARNALLAESDFDTAQKGDQFDGATGRHVTWSAQIDPTTTANLFQVTFTCQLTGGSDSSVPDETITEVFRALRSTWSQGTDAATLRAANKDLITQNLQPSPLSGITAGSGGGAGGDIGAAVGGAGKGNNKGGQGSGGGGGTGKNNNTGKGGGKGGNNNGQGQGGGGNRGGGQGGGNNGGNFFNNGGGGGNNNNNGGGNRGNNNGSGGSRRAPKQ